MATERGNLNYKFINFLITHENGIYWKNHFSTIGLIGMNEACENLLGESIATEKDYQKFYKPGNFNVIKWHSSLPLEDRIEEEGAINILSYTFALLVYIT